MIIKILGTGINHTKKDRPYLGKYKPSILVKSKGTVILVDVGNDIFKKVSKKELSQVNYILITHAHSDAINGIPRLNRFFASLNKDVPIYTIPDVISTVKLRYTSHSYDYLHLKAIGTKKKFKLGDIEVQPITVFHVPEYPTVAFNFNNKCFYGADVGPFFDNYKMEHLSNNVLSLMDGTYWDNPENAKNHITVLENLKQLLSLENKHTLFTGMGDQWISFEEANPLLKNMLEEYKKEYPESIVNEVRTAREGESISIEEDNLFKLYDPCTLLKKLDLTQEYYIVEPLISGKSEIVDDRANEIVYERIATSKGTEIVTDILLYKGNELINNTILNRFSFMHKEWLSKSSSKKLPIRCVVKRKNLFSFLKKIKKKYPRVIIRPTTSKYYDGKFIVNFDIEKADGLGQVPDHTDSDKL